MDTQVKSPLLQTLPVGSVVFSVVAKDEDSGTGGIVRYFIEKVSVASPSLMSTRGQHLHRQS